MFQIWHYHCRQGSLSNHFNSHRHQDYIINFNPNSINHHQQKPLILTIIITDTCQTVIPWLALAVRLSLIRIHRHPPCWDRWATLLPAALDHHRPVMVHQHPYHLHYQPHSVQLVRFVLICCIACEIEAAEVVERRVCLLQAVQHRPALLAMSPLCSTCIIGFIFNCWAFFSMVMVALLKNWIYFCVCVDVECWLFFCCLTAVHKATSRARCPLVRPAAQQGHRRLPRRYPHEPPAFNKYSRLQTRRLRIHEIQY